MNYEELFYIATNHHNLHERYKAVRTMIEYRKYEPIKKKIENFRTLASIRKLPKGKNKETYDDFGRMIYNPKYHFAHLINYTDEDLAYICKFYEIDGFRTVAMALGKTETTIMVRYKQLQNKNLVEHYRRLWDELWEGEQLWMYQSIKA